VSFQDRQYYQEPYGMGGGRMGGFGLPRPSPMVKYLLIANCVIFLLQLAFRGKLETLFAATVYHPFQVWRLITFQFLHDTGTPFHLLFNMIGLYFLGPLLERSWGAKRFITFYLTCGLVGGLLFVVFTSIGWLSGEYIIGASGGILGMLAACAVLFPQVTVILILFPVPIRLAAILLCVVYMLSVLTNMANAGGDLCHLGGMATGFVWVGRPYIKAWLSRLSATSYQKKSKKREMLQYELDRILAKVHEQGIQSLSGKEKKILQQATEEQKRNRM